MQFVIDDITFSVKISEIKNNIETMLILENYSLDNRKLGMPNLNKGQFCKFLFQRTSKEIPNNIRIYLESDGNTSSPYNIYPGELQEGSNYFWLNNGAFMIGKEYISLYISHDYLYNYKFTNKPQTTVEYMKEYN